MSSTKSLVLQWGRDLSVAETGSDAGALQVGFRLQWGRDLSVAETPLDVLAVLFPLLRFNGAATFQSRKPRMSVTAGIANSGLQWGRDLSVAETRELGLPAAACRWDRFNGAATFQSRKPVL